jgi:hypothetical protein
MAHDAGSAGAPPPESVDATLMHVYADLKDLLARDDLAPSVRANLVEALASVSLVVQDLALEYEMLYDLGV